MSTRVLNEKCCWYRRLKKKLCSIFDVLYSRCVIFVRYWNVSRTLVKKINKYTYIFTQKHIANANREKWSQINLFHFYIYARTNSNNTSDITKVAKLTENKAYLISPIVIKELIPNVIESNRYQCSAVIQLIKDCRCSGIRKRTMV